MCPAVPCHCQAWGGQSLPRCSIPPWQPRHKHRFCSKVVISVRGVPAATFISNILGSPKYVLSIVPGSLTVGQMLITCTVGRIVLIRNRYFKINLKQNLIMEVKDSSLLILFLLFIKPLSLVLQKILTYVLCSLCLEGILGASSHVVLSSTQV